MTPSDLRALLPRSGPLDLAIADLESPDLDVFIGAFLPQGRLRLDQITGWSATGGDGVTVTGPASTGPLAGTTVKAEFSLVDEAVALKITATGGDRWTFVTAFPILTGTVFDRLVFARPTMVLDWGPDIVRAGVADPAVAAAAFTGDLVIDARTAMLDVMMPRTGDHTLTGMVRTVTGIPGLPDFETATVPLIVLNSPEDDGFTLGPIRVQQMSYEVRTSPRFNSDMADLDVRPLVHFGAEVTSTRTSLDPVFIYGTSAALGGDTTLSATFTGPDDQNRDPEDGDTGLPLSLSTIFTMAGQTPSLPPVFTRTLPIRLVRITAGITTSPSLSLGMLTFVIQADVNWEFVPGLFTLEAVDLSLTVSNPMSSPQVTGTVSGLVGIGDSGTLELRSDLAGDTFGGGLREGDPPLSIREVYRHFTGEQPHDLPDLYVETFEFTVSPARGDRPLGYRAALEVDGTWVIGPVTLTSVAFAVARDGTVFVFRARASMLIGSTELSVSAEYDSAPGKGWEFGGSSGMGERIAIGALIKTISDDLGGPETFPKPLEGLVVQNLAASFSTGSDRLTVSGQASFEVDSVEVDLAFDVDTGTHRYGGSLAFFHAGTGYAFDVHFAQDHGVDLLAASYVHQPTTPLPDLRTLISGLSPSAGRFIPPGLTADLKDVVFGSGSAYVLSADLKATVDLSGLPLVGPHLVGDQKVGFDPLRIVAASGVLPAADVTTVNGLLPPGVAPFPARDLAAGFTLDGTLLIGPLENPVTLPVSDGAPAPVITNPPPAQSPGGQNAVWYAVQRGIGPVHVERIGLAYAHENNKPPVVGVVVDATLGVGGLTLSLDGLQASVPLTLPVQAPSFDLKGLGVSYSEGPVSVSGAFLKDTLTYKGVAYPAYNGRASISTEDLTLGAIGSYAQLPAGPSLFVYAVLDGDFGGPPFFFVTGLAAGFGYNRRLKTPDVTGIATFPLVQEALGTRPPGTLAAEMLALEPYITPSEGDGFVVAGIRFSTFKMIDSFLLATVSFGGRFEIDVLGLSTLTLPVADAANKGATPIAELQLALKATFAPSDGYFSLVAQLTPNSYLLSRACHLTGGLAFSSWFGEQHKGDFALTVGGYHPQYTKPAHYPSVPRVGFAWKISDKLSLSGGAYYALTPSALMAGGAIAVNYQDGNLRAWFNASMDFLIAWQPYHYDARFRISVGASYTYKFFGTHTINAHVDCDVHLWGPEFAGTVKVDIKVISFTIPFGNSNPNTSNTIPWSRVKATLLPADLVSISVRGGATAMGTGADLGVLDPATLVLTTGSVIPSTTRQIGSETPAKVGANFGVAPSGITSGVTANHRIRISRDGFGAEDDFVFTPVTKPLPSALWSTDPNVSVHRPEMTAPLLTGYTVSPKPHEDGASVTLAASALAAGTAAYTEPTLAWQPADTWIETARADRMAQVIVAPNVAAARASIADAVLKDPEFSFTGFDMAGYAEIPYLDPHD
ncbi:DUF6603 domain-containing protein [Herbidospora sp. RD11066]